MQGIEPRRNFFVVAGSVPKDVIPALLVKTLDRFANRDRDL